MPRMPTFEEIRDDFDRRVHAAEQAIEHPFQRRHGAPETPASQPATMKAATAAAPQQEDTMAFIDDLEGFIADVREVGPQAIADVKALGAAAVADLKAVKANPETAVVLGNLSLLAKAAAEVGIPVGAITDIAKPIEALLKLYAPDPAPAVAPSAPVAAPVAQ